MAKLTFSDAQLSASEKKQFTTSLFHDNDSWKVEMFDIAKNGAKSSSASAGDDPSPCLRVQRVVNGVPTGPVERLFISSLYRDDETCDGVLLPKSGAINAIVKQCWDNPTLTSDALAVKAVIDAIYGLHPDGIITCHRQVARDANGQPLRKLTYRGDLRVLVVMNWD